MGLLQDQIYPVLLAQDYGRELFAKLGEAKREGHEWIAECPRCGKQKFSYNSMLPLWKCWVCEADGFSGDWMGWLTQQEGMDFNAALKMLAQRAGVTLSGGGSRQDWEQEKRRQDVLSAANEFFLAEMFSERGRDVLEFCRQRGYSDEEIRRMGLGAYTDDGLLLRFLAERGITGEAADAAGLLTKGYGSIWRLTLAWPDASGRPTTFGARSLLPQEKLDELNAPKYKYAARQAKASTLVGLPTARTYNWAVLVEGGLDAAYLTALGVPAMGVGGLIITQPQVNAILTTNLKKLFVCLDNEPDGRGEQGTVKTLRTLSLQEKVMPYVVTLDGGEKDPDEYVRKHGLEAFEQCLKRSEGWPTWLARYEAKQWKRAGDPERDEMLRRIGQFSGRCANTVHREQFLKDLAAATGIDYVILSRLAGQEQPTPESIDLERSVLGYVLDNPHVAREFMALVKPEDMQSRDHARALTGMLYLLNRGMACDRATLVDWARSTGWLDQSGTRTVIERLRSDAVNETEAYTHARLVREKSQLRRIGDVAQELMQVSRGGHIPPAGIIDRAVNNLRGITAGDVQPGEVDTLHEIAQQEQLRLDHLYSLPPEERSRGLTTGLSKWLDDTTGGFLPGDMWGWAARTGHGKTKLLAYAMAVASLQYRVGWINLEMGVVRLMKYLLPSVYNARNPEDRIHAGTIYDPDWWDAQSSAELADRVTRLDPEGNFLVAKQPRYKTISAVRSYIREMAERGAKVVAIDQLEQVAEFARGIQKDRSALRDTIWSIKDAATQNGVATIVINQLSRAAADAPTNVAQFSEGGGFENMVDFAVLLTDLQAKTLALSGKGMVVDKFGIPSYPKAEDFEVEGRVLEDLQNPRPVEIKLAKSRDGVTGKRMLRFDYVYGIKERAT